ncbi:MbcA/ParS/Xre antitoxin family protein [Marinobacter sp. LV10R510-11A]|uniref:MbcA/ParS/Xre antitoxin family protein n=1 Tax=Marinobacter sp. LV10R510-11A TaxID=1415568 RepID=UPI000BB6DD13|nr:MbcA/ParS/Xre antitoxin family protein [Marinobacter sp. LV10R510-11A]
MSEFNNLNCTPFSVLQMAEVVFESRQIALEWLKSPVPALGGKTPRQVIQSPEGCERVLEVLKKLENGEFS